MLLVVPACRFEGAALEVAVRAHLSASVRAHASMHIQVTSIAVYPAVADEPHIHWVVVEGVDTHLAAEEVNAHFVLSGALLYFCC